MKYSILKLKIEFGGTEKVFTDPVEDYVISFIHKVLGKNNKWHNGFSDYSVSTLLGGTAKDGGMSFADGAYVYVSSTNEDFINTLTANLVKKQDELYLRDMKVTNFSFPMSTVHSDYDLIRTNSPLLLKVKDDRIVTYQDEDFIDLLTSQSRKKLSHLNCFSENEIDSLKIEPFHFEGASVRYAKRKNFSLPTSMVKLIVKGKATCRKALYEMGLGNSTGYCFGAVEILSK
jgi:CRISPR-associated endoribonuclease Cas6